MRARALWLLPVAVTALFGIGTATAQNISFGGKVTMQDGTPVAGAEVVATPATEGKGMRKVKTGSDGTYRIPFADFGSWRVRATKDKLLIHTVSILVRKNNVVLMEKQGQLNKAQEIPELQLAPGSQATYDFVMVDKSYFDNLITAEDADRINAQLSDADKLTQAGKYAESDAILDELVKRLPNNASVAYLKGLNAAMTNRPAEAKTFLEKALELKPDMPGVRAQLGALAFAQGDKKAAADWFRKELEISPDALPVRINLAQVIAEVGTKDEAIAAWQDVITRAPNEAGAYNELAAIYIELGQEDKAIEVLKKMEEVAKPDANAWYNIGAGLANRDQLDGAEAAFRKALSLNPDMALANRELGYILARNAKGAEAIPFFEKYLKLAPNADDAKEIATLVTQLKAAPKTEAAPAQKPAKKK